MNNKLTNDLIKIMDGQPKTTSLKIAEVFDKRHKNIIQSIQRVNCSREFNELNFQPVEYIDSKGEKRPYYNITKDGFVFLVMGYRGEKAAKFKEAYINEFNARGDMLKEAFELVPLLLKGMFDEMRKSLLIENTISNISETEVISSLMMYKGSNTFIHSLRKYLYHRGKLSKSQLAWANKILNYSY